MRCNAILIAALSSVLPLHPQTAPTPTSSLAWKQLEFLLGKWTGAAGPKDTPLGAGQGDFSFDPELSRHIVVRHNNASYASGVTHDDLMVIYFEPADTPHAIYFDSEGHVIRYDLAVPEPNRAVFESAASEPGPRYRLSYWLEGRTLHGKFEVAPPGQAYQAYMSWTAIPAK